MRHEYARTIEPARTLAAETLTLERKLKAEGQRLMLKACPCYALSPPEIALMWQTAPSRMPVPRPATGLE